MDMSPVIICNRDDAIKTSLCQLLSLISVMLTELFVPDLIQLNFLWNNWIILIKISHAIYL